MYHLFNYNKQEIFKFKTQKEEDRGNLKLISFTFDSPFNTAIKENDTVYSEIFINKNKDSTLLILLHGFASKIDKLDNYYKFIHEMLNEDISCSFIQLPYHLYRTPGGKNSGEKLIYFDDRETLDFYHQAVVDVRRLIDIATDTFKFKKVILVGFSLGSMISVIATAIDSRIHKAALIFGGGNWYHIHWNSSLSHILKGNCVENGNITKKKCRQFYSDFGEFVEEFKKTDLNSKISSTLIEHAALKQKTTRLCFLCDPLAFAHRIDTDKILMLNSRFDYFFPKKSSIQLWEALGKPDIYWFNKFHTSTILANPRAQRLIKDFIKD